MLRAMSTRTVPLPSYLTARLQAQGPLPLLESHGGAYDVVLPAPSHLVPQLDQWADPRELSSHFDLYNLRTSQTPLAPSAEKPSQLGMAALRTSGSAQYTAAGLHDLVLALRAGDPALKPDQLYVFDLREEPHLMVDGLSVSWQVPHPQPGLEPWLFGQTAGLAHRAPGGWLTTEAQAAQKLGVHYGRLAVTDQCAPSRQVLDQFVSDMRALPPHAWVHFHCAAGIGRTTTFMCLRDMMANAKQVSFNDILARQALIGGMDLRHFDPCNANARGRYEVLQQFYDYCKSNTDGFATPYSAWLQGRTEGARSQPR